MSIRTVTDIAGGVRAGDLRAADVVERHLDAIAAREPEIHAFNHLMADAARERAAAIDAASPGFSSADGRVRIKLETPFSAASFGMTCAHSAGASFCDMMPSPELTGRRKFHWHEACRVGEPVHGLFVNCGRETGSSE